MPAEVLVPRVRELVRDAVGLDVPSDTEDLIDGAYLDSLALVELLFSLEREFNVDLLLEELDVDALRTVHSISEFVDSRSNGRGELTA
jgi:acyl carrier protein